MIIWKGRGIMAIIILAICVILLSGIPVAKTAAGTEPMWPMGLGFMLGGVFTYLYGLTFGGTRRPGGQVIDGQIASNNSLYYIPYSAWPWIFFILGVFAFLGGIFGG